jgi:hypothetical protein
MVEKELVISSVSKLGKALIYNQAGTLFLEIGRLSISELNKYCNSEVGTRSVSELREKYWFKTRQIFHISTKAWICDKNTLKRTVTKAVRKFVNTCSEKEGKL